MNSKTLNIVSFDVPYPPNYGGVIDVFYKIKKLNELGIKIILHTFEYGSGEQMELEKICSTVYYYKRTRNLNFFFSKLPYIVKSRTNDELIQNLQLNNYPILFEGLHTTFPLLNNSFKNRILLVRAHNIEHNYYEGLAKSESNLFKKLFFRIESLKLKKYENLLNKANHILTISLKEHDYFYAKFGKKSVYVPVFHEHQLIKSQIGKGKYALYHGDLRVSDNLKACYYLTELFSKINFPLIIASSFSASKLELKLKKHQNIQFIKLTSQEELTDLIQNAHINVLPTFQNTGIKLKLINALYIGRYCLVNNKMIKETGLENTCIIANTENEFLEHIKILSNQDFTQNDVVKRKTALEQFDTTISAKKIIDLLN